MTNTWFMKDEHLQIQLPELFDFDVILDYLTRDTNLHYFFVKIPLHFSESVLLFKCKQNFTFEVMVCP